MKTILLVGATGLLGSSLVSKLRLSNYKVITQSRADGADIKFDLRDYTAWQNSLESYLPHTIVNLAAATNVDECELNPKMAFDGNVAPILAMNKAINCSKLTPHVIYVSTDQLYYGQGPHPETDVRPCNVYGMSKLCGELALKKYPSTIIRTNFFGLSHASHRISFSDWIVESIKSNKEITLFDDVYFSPLHINTLCEYLQLVIEREVLGTFNVGSSNGLSKARFGFRLISALGLDPSVIRVGRVNDVSLRAERPKDMRMISERFKDAFSLQIPDTITEINKAAQEFYD